MCIDGRGGSAASVSTAYELPCCVRLHSPYLSDGVNINVQLTLVSVTLTVEGSRRTGSLDRIMPDIRLCNGDSAEILTSHCPLWMFNSSQSTYTAPTSCAPGKATYLLKMAAILPYAGNSIGPKLSGKSPVFMRSRTSEWFNTSEICAAAVIRPEQCSAMLFRDQFFFPDPLGITGSTQEFACTGSKSALFRLRKQFPSAA